MDDNALDGALGSIGKGCFARHFEIFAEAARGSLSSEEAILRISQANPEYDTDSIKSFRLKNAIRIFKAKREQDALARIAGSVSPLLDPADREKALRLLGQRLDEPPGQQKS